MLACYLKEIESEAVITETVYETLKELGLSVHVIGYC